MHVFSTYKTGIMTTLNDFIMCCAGTGRFRKKVCLAFSLVHISFLRILFIWFILFIWPNNNGDCNGNDDDNESNADNDDAKSQLLIKKPNISLT